MLVNSYPVGHVGLNSGWHRMCAVLTTTTIFFIHCVCDKEIQGKNLCRDSLVKSDHITRREDLLCKK